MSLNSVVVPSGEDGPSMYSDIFPRMNFNATVTGQSTQWLTDSSGFLVACLAWRFNLQKCAIG